MCVADDFSRFHSLYPSKILSVILPPLGTSFSSPVAALIIVVQPTTLSFVCVPRFFSPSVAVVADVKRPKLLCSLRHNGTHIY